MTHHQQHPKHWSALYKNIYMYRTTHIFFIKIIHTVLDKGTEGWWPVHVLGVQEVHRAFELCWGMTQQTNVRYVCSPGHHPVHCMRPVMSLYASISSLWSGVFSQFL